MHNDRPLFGVRSPYLPRSNERCAAHEFRVKARAIFPAEAVNYKVFVCAIHTNLYGPARLVRQQQTQDRTDVTTARIHTSEGFAESLSHRQVKVLRRRSD